MITPERQTSATEERYFGKLRDACAADDPAVAIDCLTAWLGVCCELSGVTAREFASQIDDESLADEIGRLDQAISTQRVWSGNALYRVLDRIRNRLLDHAKPEIR